MLYSLGYYNPNNRVSSLYLSDSCEDPTYKPDVLSDAESGDEIRGSAVVCSKLQKSREPERTDGISHVGQEKVIAENCSKINVKQVG